jgi:hypothetical protein
MSVFNRLNLHPGGVGLPNSSLLTTYLRTFSSSLPRISFLGFLHESHQSLHGFLGIDEFFHFVHELLE